jgi:uncharacterized phage infection (PIP) family protein YhgE
VKHGVEVGLIVLIMASITLILYAVVFLHTLSAVLVKADMVLDGVPAMESQVQFIEKNSTDALAEIGGMANVARHIEIEERDQEAAQIKQAAQMADKMNALLDAGATAIGTVTGAAASAQKDVDANSKQLVEATAQLTKTLSEGATTLKTAGDQLGQVGPILVETHAAVANLDAISADGKQVADHYRDLVLKPASKAKETAKFIASLAGDVLHAIF